MNPDHRAQIFLVTRSGGQTHSFRHPLPRANLCIYVFILSNTVVSKYVMDAKWKEKVERRKGGRVEGKEVERWKGGKRERWKVERWKGGR